MHVLSLLCFIVGGVVGWFASRRGGWVQVAWPVVLRVQILLTSATLSLVAAWRLTSLDQLLGPLVLAGALWVLLVAAVATRGSRSSGEAMLESWAVGPNSGFWVVPVATAFAGSAGAMIAVLANSANVGQNAVSVHFMRREPADTPAALHHVGATNPRSWRWSSGSCCTWRALRPPRPRRS